MNWLSNSFVSITLACAPGALFSQSALQDDEGKKGNPSHEQGSELAGASASQTQAKTGERQSPDLIPIEALNAQGLAYQDKAQYDQAEPLFLNALTLCEKYQGAEQPLVLVATLNNLAWVYSKQHRYDKAEPLYRRALAIQEKALRPDHPDLAETLKDYAVLLRKTNRKSEANAFDRRAKSIVAKNPETALVDHTINVRALGLRSSQE